MCCLRNGDERSHGSEYRLSCSTSSYTSVYVLEPQSWGWYCLLLRQVESLTYPRVEMLRCSLSSLEFSNYFEIEFSLDDTCRARDDETVHDTDSGSFPSHYTQCVYQEHST